MIFQRNESPRSDGDAFHLHRVGLDHRFVHIEVQQERHLQAAEKFSRRKN